MAILLISLAFELHFSKSESDTPPLIKTRRPLTDPKGNGLKGGVLSLDSTELCL